MYYEKIFRAFQNYKVHYLVAGGMAVNLYGIPRFTKDLDILIDPSISNLDRLKKALEELGYRPKPPVSLPVFLNPKNWEKWHREKGMIACNLYNPSTPYEEIDILIHSPVSFDQAKRHRRKIKVERITIALVSMNDLIKMKQKAGRKQDLADIEALTRVKLESRRGASQKRQ